MSVEQKYRYYMDFLGWTEEDFAEFYGYKNLNSFQKSSAREKRKAEFVGTFELAVESLIDSIDRLVIETDNNWEEVKDSWQKTKDNLV